MIGILGKTQSTNTWRSAFCNCVVGKLNTPFTYRYSIVVGFIIIGRGWMKPGRSTPGLDVSEAGESGDPRFVNAFQTSSSGCTNGLSK